MRNDEGLLKITEAMRKRGLKQILITDPSSIFYITGKWIHAGERMLALLIREDGKHRIFINRLFPVTEDLGIEKVWFNDTDDSLELIKNELINEEKLGVDKLWPSGFLIKLMEKNAASAYEISSDIVDYIRQRKDENEREKMRYASRLNDEAMEMLKTYLRDNNDVSEEEAAKFLSSIYKDLGADGFSFEPIIAFGPNGADPHHGNDSTIAKKGDSVIIDIGCKKDSYCSDMTRTLFYREVSEEHRKVYEICKNANLEGIKMVKPGNTFKMVDDATRKYIEDRGYGKYFTHRTGHSIGIDTHEFGDVSSVNEQILEEGMIFSVEPGIYLPGDMGVRIEDLVLVTKDGCEVLNSVSKEIEII